MTKLKEFREKIQGKKVVVVGIGLQGGGVDACLFFSKLGAEVVATDLKKESQLRPSLEKLKEAENIRFTLGNHNKSDFEGAFLVLKGPTVPWESEFIKIAEKSGAKIYTTFSLFLELSETENIVGVTGTRGKTTTSYLAYEVLKAAGKEVFLLGNIPFSYTLNALFKLKKSSWVVFELSSWQLSGLHKTKKSPKYAIFTNFYPDHLNFYKNMDEYLWDKAAIFLYQNPDDILFLNQRFKGMLKDYKVRSKIILFKPDDFREEIRLPGEHNRENAAAAFKFSSEIGVSSKVAKRVISKFKGVPYRLEKVGEKDGVLFVNDATSTTPTAGVAAIRAFENLPIFLIVGGDSKGLPFEELLQELSKVKEVFFLKGSFTDEVFEKARKMYPKKVYSKIFSNLKEAVLEAYRKAVEAKGVVLFSPSATSFSMFNNEFERGEEFNRIVKEVISYGKKGNTQE